MSDTTANDKLKSDITYRCRRDDRMYLASRFTSEWLHCIFIDRFVEAEWLTYISQLCCGLPAPTHIYLPSKKIERTKAIKFSIGSDIWFPVFFLLLRHSLRWLLSLCVSLLNSFATFVATISFMSATTVMSPFAILFHFSEKQQQRKWKTKNCYSGDRVAYHVLLSAHNHCKQNEKPRRQKKRTKISSSRLDVDSGCGVWMRLRVRELLDVPCSTVVFSFHLLLVCGRRNNVRKWRTAAATANAV